MTLTARKAPSFDFDPPRKRSFSDNVNSAPSPIHPTDMAMDGAPTNDASTSGIKKRSSHRHGHNHPRSKSCGHRRHHSPSSPRHHYSAHGKKTRKRGTHHSPDRRAGGSTGRPGPPRAAVCGRLWIRPVDLNVNARGQFSSPLIRPATTDCSPSAYDEEMMMMPEFALSPGSSSSFESSFRPWQGKTTGPKGSGSRIIFGESGKPIRPRRHGF